MGKIFTPPTVTMNSFTFLNNCVFLVSYRNTGCPDILHQCCVWVAIRATLTWGEIINLKGHYVVLENNFKLFDCSTGFTHTIMRSTLLMIIYQKCSCVDFSTQNFLFFKFNFELVIYCHSLGSTRWLLTSVCHYLLTSIFLSNVMPLHSNVFSFTTNYLAWPALFQVSRVDRKLCGWVTQL